MSRWYQSRFIVCAARLVWLICTHTIVAMEKGGLIDPATELEAKERKMKTGEFAKEKTQQERAKQQQKSKTTSQTSLTSQPLLESSQQPFSLNPEQKLQLASRESFMTTERKIIDTIKKIKEGSGDKAGLLLDLTMLDGKIDKLSNLGEISQELKQLQEQLKENIALIKSDKLLDASILELIQNNATNITDHLAQLAQPESESSESTGGFPIFSDIGEQLASKAGKPIEPTRLQQIVTQENMIPLATYLQAVEKYPAAAAELITSVINELPTLASEDARKSAIDDVRENLQGMIDFLKMVNRVPVDEPTIQKVNKIGDQLNTLKVKLEQPKMYTEYVSLLSEIKNSIEKVEGKLQYAFKGPVEAKTNISLVIASIANLQKATSNQKKQAEKEILRKNMDSVSKSLETIIAIESDPNTIEFLKQGKKQIEDYLRGLEKSKIPDTDFLHNIEIMSKTIAQQLDQIYSKKTAPKPAETIYVPPARVPEFVSPPR